MRQACSAEGGANLPAMAYYGVDTDEAVLMRMSSVPRGAAAAMGTAYAAKRDVRGSKPSEVREWLDGPGGPGWDAAARACPAPSTSASGAGWTSLPASRSWRGPSSRRIWSPLLPRKIYRRGRRARKTDAGKVEWQAIPASYNSSPLPGRLAAGGCLYLSFCSPGRYSLACSMALSRSSPTLLCSAISVLGQYRSMNPRPRPIFFT